MEKVTVKTIAKKAGVSPAAVSIAMNGKGGISEETKQRILQIAQELGYRQSKNRSSAETRKIVFLASEADGAFRGRTLDALIDTMLVNGTRFSVISPKQAFHDPQSLSDCELLITFDTLSREQLNLLAPLSHKMLILDGDYPREPFHNLRFDYAGAAYLITRHLSEMGHRSFIYYNRDMPMPKSLLCFNGFQKYLLEQQLSLDSKQIILDENSTPNVLSHLREIIQSFNVSAIVCTSVSAASYITEKLSQSGYHVPRDLSVAVITSTMPERTVGVSFTRIGLNCEQYSHILRNIATDISSLTKLPQNYLISPTPIVSGSSVTAPKYDPSTKKIGFSFIQKEHPSMRVVRAGFLEMCRQMGYQTEIRAIDGEGQDQLDKACKELSESGISGAVIWTPYPSVVRHFREKHIPTVCLHCLSRSTPNAGWQALVTLNPLRNAAVTAAFFAEKLQGKTGCVAVSQSSNNSFETAIANEFRRLLQEKCPQLSILQDIYFVDYTEQSMDIATDFILQHPDLLGAFSTCGTAGITWAMAKAELSRDDMIIVGTDYDEESLRLLKECRIDALVGQPLHEEAQDGVRAIDSILRGSIYSPFKALDVPLITVQDMDKYERQIHYVNNWYS